MNISLSVDFSQESLSHKQSPSWVFSSTPPREACMTLYNLHREKPEKQLTPERMLYSAIIGHLASEVRARATEAELHKARYNRALDQMSHNHSREVVMWRKFEEAFLA